MYYFILQDRRLLQPKASLPTYVQIINALVELEESANE
jgi:hypothetical protein